MGPRQDVTITDTARHVYEALSLLRDERSTPPAYRREAMIAIEELKTLRDIARRLDDQVHAVRQLSTEWACIARYGHWYDGAELTDDQTRMIKTAAKAMDNALAHGPWMPPTATYATYEGALEAIVKG